MSKALIYHSILYGWLDAMEAWSKAALFKRFAPGISRLFIILGDPSTLRVLLIMTSIISWFINSFKSWSFFKRSMIHNVKKSNSNYFRAHLWSLCIRSFSVSLLAENSFWCIFHAYPMIASTRSKLNPFVSRKRVPDWSWPLESSSVIYRFHYSPRRRLQAAAPVTPPHRRVLLLLLRARLSRFVIKSVLSLDEFSRQVFHELLLFAYFFPKPRRCLWLI